LRQSYCKQEDCKTQMNEQDVSMTVTLQEKEYPFQVFRCSFFLHLPPGLSSCGFPHAEDFQVCEDLEENEFPTELYEEIKP